MPLINFKSEQIAVNISDKVLGDTIIKQTATFVSLRYSQDERESMAEITVLVKPFASNKGAYGDSLISRGINSYYVTLTAKNDTLVEFPSGEIIAVRSNENDQQWAALAALHPTDCCLQGDLMEILREQPTKIGDIIRHHIAEADRMGRFKA